MKAAIVGSRTFNDYKKVVEFITNMKEIYELEDIDLVVSGGARGADALGAKYAKEHGIELKVFPAKWSIYGKKAGILRNVDIIENCDVCFVFWDGESHGAKHDIELCKKSKKPCFIYNYITTKTEIII